MANLDVLEKIQAGQQQGQAVNNQQGTAGTAPVTTPVAPIAIPKIGANARVSSSNGNAGTYSDLLKGANTFNQNVAIPSVVRRQSTVGPLNAGGGVQVDTGKNFYNQGGDPSQIQAESQANESWLQKAGDVISTPFKSLLKGLGYAASGLDAGIQQAGNFITSPLTAAALVLTDKNAAKQGYMKTLSDTFSSGEDTVMRTLNGEGAASELEIGQHVANFLTATGGDAGRSQTVGAALNTVGDILFSPTTYLTLGIGGGTKIATETGQIALSSKGTQVFKDLVNAVQNVPKVEAQNLAKQAIIEAVQSGKTELNGVKLIDMIDQGGVKLAGRTLPGSVKLEQTLNGVKDVASSVIHSVPGFDKVSTVVKNLFVPVVDQITNKIVQQVVEKYRTLGPAVTEKLQNQIITLTKGLSKDAAEVIRYNRGNAEALAQLTPEEQAIAKKIYGFLDEVGGNIKESDPGFQTIDNFMHQAYKENPAQITKKLDQANELIQQKVANGETLSEGEQHLKDLFDKGKGKLSGAKGKPGFYNEKFFSDTKLGEAAGLTPVNSLHDVLNDYARQAGEYIGKQGLVNELVTKFGVNAVKMARAASGEIDYAAYGVKTAEEFVQKFPDLKSFTEHVLGDSSRPLNGIQTAIEKAANSGDFATVGKLLDTVPSESQMKGPLESLFRDMVPKDYQTTQAASKTLGVQTKQQLRLIYNSAKNEIATTDFEAAKRGIKDPVVRTLTDGSKAYLPKDISDLVDRLAKRGATADSLPPGLSHAVKAYDYFTQAYKTLITTPFPAFSARNFFDSTSRMVLDVGLYQSMRPTVMADAWRMATKGGGEKVVELAGQKYTLSEIRELAAKAGVINTGEVAKTGLQATRKFTDPFENTTRLQQFMLTIDKTGDIETAANAVKKFQYDYSKLTNFERQVMQRIFPFYTFTRKNVPFQVEQALKNPGIYGGISKAYESMQRQVGNSDPGAVPSYIKQGFYLPLGKSEDGTDNYLGQTGLSYEAANTETDVFSGEGFQSNVVGQSNPLLQMTGELLQRKNYFTGKSFDAPGGSDTRYQMAATSLLNKVAPGVVNYSSGYITNKDGSKRFVATANPVVNTILDTLPTTRFVGTASSLMRPDQSAGVKASSFLSGIKTYNVDPVQTASSTQYYSAKDIVDQGIHTLLQMSYIKQKSNGSYTVNYNFSSGNESLDAQLRQEALELVAAKNSGNPQEYVKKMQQ